MKKHLISFYNLRFLGINARPSNSVDQPFDAIITYSQVCICSAATRPLCGWCETFTEDEFEEWLNSAE